MTYSDMLELLTMKSQWRRDMEQMLADRNIREANQGDEDDDLSADSSSSTSEDNAHHVFPSSSPYQICT